MAKRGPRKLDAAQLTCSFRPDQLKQISRLAAHETESVKSVMVRILIDEALAARGVRRRRAA